MNLIILDDGHGIETPGKRTPDGYQENNFNRAVVERLRQLLLSNHNYDVFITAGESYDVPLLTRVSRANEAHKTFITSHPDGKCVLLSIHYNALGNTWGEQNGIETYYNTQLDKKLADVIHRSLLQGTEQTDRGVKQAKFTILTANMPSCLCECGFMDNPREAELMKSESFINEVATELYMGIVEYFNPGKDEKMVVNYKRTAGGVETMWGDIKDLSVAQIMCENKNIPAQYKNFVNGTFFWYQDKSRKITYPTSILYANKKVYQDRANHISRGCHQSCLIIYNDGTVDMMRLGYLSELKNLSEIKLVIGGLGLVNKKDKSFKYSPAVEGFYGNYSDVLRYTDKTVIGYHKGENKIYLINKKCYHDTLQKICDEEDESKGYNFHFALSLDGGGSATFRYNGENKVLGDNRRIDNIIGFGLDQV